MLWYEVEEVGHSDRHTNDSLIRFLNLSSYQVDCVQNPCPSMGIVMFLFFFYFSQLMLCGN